METLQEIQNAVEKLSHNEFSRFLEWFNEYEASIWDKKMETDIKVGKLDSIAKQAIADFQNGKCRKI